MTPDGSFRWQDRDVLDTWTLTWGDDSRVVTATNPEEFVGAVREAVNAVANSNVILELVAPSGAEMTVGFGLPSVATFRAGQDPPYFVSQGIGSADESLVFFRQGHWSEFSGEAGISPGDALEAVVEFVTTGERPTNISWREV